MIPSHSWEWSFQAVSQGHMLRSTLYLLCKYTKISYSKAVGQEPFMSTNPPQLPPPTTTTTTQFIHNAPPVKIQATEMETREGVQSITPHDYQRPSLPLVSKAALKRVKGASSCRGADPWRSKAGEAWKAKWFQMHAGAAAEMFWGESLLRCRKDGFGLGLLSRKCDNLPLGFPLNTVSSNAVLNSLHFTSSPKLKTFCGMNTLQALTRYSEHLYKPCTVYIWLFFICALRNSHVTFNTCMAETVLLSRSLSKVWNTPDKMEMK